MTDVAGHDYLSRHGSAAETMYDVRPTWRDRAVCKGVDPHIFWRDDLWSIAASVCDTCPVDEQCLEAGYDEYDFSTFRARMTPEERRKLARRRQDRRYRDDRHHLAVTDEASAAAEGVRGVLATLIAGLR